MSKIILDSVAGGYNLQTINANFDKIELELNNKVLYRDNPIGEVNVLNTDIDMNGKRIYNLPVPLSASEPARLGDVQAMSGYTLPVATSSVLGGVKQGANVTIAGDGTLSVAAAGSVTSTSVVAANGFSGSVATATTTPTITITTSVSGLLKGNGTAVSAAINSDLPAMSATVGGAVPTPPNNTTTFLRGDGTFATPAGSGDMVLASIQTITGAKTFGAVGNVDKLIVAGTTSGTTIVNATAVAGATTVTLPAATDTLVGKATVDTLTNKTFNTAGTGNVFQINSVTINTNTGTGANVLATTPTLVTPVLGVATATSINKITFTQPATGSTLTIANGKTATVNNSLTFAGTDASVHTFQATDTIVGRATTDTLTNKRVNPRFTTATSYTTSTTINSDTTDLYVVTAQAGALLFNNPTGTPVDGQCLWIAVTGTAARALTWGTSFEASTIALPATTVTTARLDMGFIWRADTSKWHLIGVA